MKRLTRRDFVQWLAAAGLAAPTAMHAGPSASGRVVVVGGGFGGATCANFLRRVAPQLDVTLIEPKSNYITCPFSNTVLGGFNNLQYITHSYDQLKSRRGCKLLTDRVVSVDPAAGTLRLQGGTSVSYDRLVIAPGVRFLWNSIEGHSESASASIPHAWNGGEQTELLLQQLRAMPDGGLVVISAPRRPFRAPPAVLERASLIAYYLSQSKPKSKVLLLDPSDEEPKLALFHKAWEQLYPGMIERVGGAGAEVSRVDTAQRTVHTTGGSKHQGAVLNLIPPQRAAEIAGTAGLADGDGWCPIDQQTFESKLQKRIHVIGDACIAGDLPKTAFAANAQAKVCATAIIASFNGNTMPEPIYNTAFYSLLSPKYAVSEASAYSLTNGRIVTVSTGMSEATVPKRIRLREAEYAAGWYKAITSEMLAL